MATKTKAEKPELKTGVIKNVAFYYTTINTPTLTKGAKDAGLFIDDEKPHLNTEYVVKVVIPRTKMKQIAKKFPKCSNIPHMVEYSQEEFAETFHDGDVSSIPDLGQKEDEELCLVKFAQKASVKGGKPTKKPKCIGIKGKVQDRNGEAINDEILIGNGSLGMIQFRPVDFGDNGIYLYPQSICITDLVVYEGAEADDDFEGYNLEELDDVSDEDMEEDMEEAMEHFDNDFED